MLNLLNAIIANVEDYEEVRQAAVGVVLSYHPNAGWWNQIAAQTWTEPSRHVAAFLYSTISSVANFENDVDETLRHQLVFCYINVLIYFILFKSFKLI